MPFNYPWSLLVIVRLLIVPINITGIRGEPTVLEGSNLQLTCEALSRPKPNITWTKEKPGNQGNTGVVQEGKVLTVTNIKRTDAGQFTCTAYNGFGKSKNRTVYVNVTCEYEFKKIDYVKWRCTSHIFNCVVMYCAVNYKLNFSKNGLFTTSNCKMVSMEQTNRKTHIEEAIISCCTTLQHFISSNGTMYAFKWKVLD